MRVVCNVSVWIELSFPNLDLISSIILHVHSFEILGHTLFPTVLEFLDVRQYGLKSRLNLFAVSAICLVLQSNTQ